MFSTLEASTASLDDPLGVSTLRQGGVATRRLESGSGDSSTLGDGGCGAIRCRRGGGIGKFLGVAIAGRGDATIKLFLVTVVVSRRKRLG